MRLVSSDVRRAGRNQLHIPCRYPKNVTMLGRAHVLPRDNGLSSDFPLPATLGRFAPVAGGGWSESPQGLGRFAAASGRECTAGEPLVSGRSLDHNRRMPRATRSYLDRFPLISTHHLASAREATAKFWPKHTSDVLGPEDYALQMNRVLLGSLAVSYVVCTS